MVYLLLGADREAKERKIDEIKKQWSVCGDALTLDYELLHSIKLDPAVLKKALLALPAVAQKRLVLIRAVEKLTPHHKEIILDFIRAEDRPAVLILDSGETSAGSGFLCKVAAAAQVTRFGQGAPKENVFDMTRAIEDRNPSRALKILGRLMEQGDHPLKVVGGLVWFWGSLKRRLPADKFKKGLLVLQEADLNIKRSRLKPEFAVEIAVTKLSSVMAG